MTVEVRPLGDKCNIRCRYCYQEQTRAALPNAKSYDIDEILGSLEALDQPFSLFGGEAMLTETDDLTRLFALGRSRHGRNALQTNGTLVEASDLELFRDYDVRVGVSIDGPEALNDLRWVGGLRQTRRATARTEAVIEALCRRGRPPRVIVTLHRVNAGSERLSVLCDWLAFLDALGVRSVRLHMLEADEPDAEESYRLTSGELLVALRRLRDLETSFTHLRFDLFSEITAMLRGDDGEASCVFHACDPYATQAVVGVEADGRLSNCGRTLKEGVPFTRAAGQGYERQLGLYRTPQAEGGCNGCRFFLMCKGSCPGMAKNGDWRLRSDDCETWFALFEDAERAMLDAHERPLSLSEQRPAIETAMVKAWGLGSNPSLAALKAMFEPT